MIDTTKKILCYTAITSVLNSSFLPAYAGKMKVLDDTCIEANHSYLCPLMKDDPATEILQTSTSLTQTWMPEIVKEAGSYSFSALKGLLQLPRLASKGITYALKHPINTLTLGLSLQARGVHGGNEFILNQGTANTQAGPSIASLPNGNAFAVWQSSFVSDDIYGRVFLPGGTPLGNDFLINQNTTGSQQIPSVIALVNGTVFVTWWGAQAGTRNIYERLFYPDGTAYSNELFVNQVITGDKNNPTAASLPNGNILELWDLLINSDINARVLSSTGTPLGSEYIINQNVTGSQFGASITNLLTGNLFSVWAGDQRGNNDIYGRILSSDGATLGNEFLVNQNVTGSQYNPSITNLPSGDAFAVWVGDQTGDADIYGRVLSSSGTPLGNEFLVNQNVTGQQYSPSVVYISNGYVFVIWRSYQGSLWNVYARLMSEDGIPLSNEFIINQNTLGSTSKPSVAVLLNTNVFTAWDSNQAGNYDCFGRIFDNIDISALLYPAPLPAPAPAPMPVSAPVTATLSSGGGVTNTLITTSQMISATPAPSSSTYITSDSSTSVVSPSTITTLTPVPASVTSTQSSGGGVTSTLITTSQMISATPVPSSSAYITSDSSTIALTPSSIQTAIPSTAFSNETAGESWQTGAAIGGGIGAAALIGGVVAIIAAKKFCYPKIKKTVNFSESSFKLTDRADSSFSEEDVEAPVLTQAASPFEAKSSGYTEHPTFVGAIEGDTYEIWKKLSSRDADRLRPLTSISIPSLGTSKKLKFNLGKGNYGSTYAGKNRDTSTIYAIKEVYGQEVVDESLREGKIVHFLGSNPNVMPLIDYIHYKPSETTEHPRLLQVMPLAYVNGIGLKNMLSPLPNKNREIMVSDSFYQMMMGLAYIHSKGVVHLDIKADNTLYMKDGTLRIADFGKAKHVGDDDQITDGETLGDVRKFSPEIVAFIRKCLKINFETADSFSGKGADVWAAGLFIWELLEDDEKNLFSMQSFVLKPRARTYTYKHFEELVENISLLKEKFSQSLLNLLRQVMAVDPEIRVGTDKIIKKLSASAMSSGEREAAFAEVISSYTKKDSSEEGLTSPIPVFVYPFADPALYLKKSKNGEQSPVYIPSDLYIKQKSGRK